MSLATEDARAAAYRASLRARRAAYTARQRRLRGNPAAADALRARVEALLPPYDVVTVAPPEEEEGNG